MSKLFRQYEVFVIWCWSLQKSFRPYDYLFGFLRIKFRACCIVPLCYMNLVNKPLNYCVVYVESDKTCKIEINSFGIGISVEY